MKLGIMQPYFFPYLGYFDLINRTDQWVVFDVVKYTPKSWMNRNRILDNKGGMQYVSVPVDKHCGEGLIREVVLVDKDAAYRRILGQIEHYRKARAPRYQRVRALIDECFAPDITKLCDLNVRTLALVCDHLEMDFNHQVMSEMGLEIPDIQHPGQWALEISDAMGAEEYINPPGGKSIFKPEEFEQRGIKLSFTELVNYTYSCGPYEFMEYMSIIDVLMWNEPTQIKGYLDGLAQGHG